MNILLTSAGRRTYMVDYFKKAVGADGRVYAANSQMSPALREADGYIISPVIFSSEYVPFLLDKCRELRIDLLVALFDIDMPVLSEHRKEFEDAGTRLAMSDRGFYDICSDKLNMGTILSRQGFNTARAFSEKAAAQAAVKAGELHFPLIIKPRFGMGSIGVYKVYNATELEGAYSMCERETLESYLKYESSRVPADNAVLIQECIEGTEYGLDVICDLDGNYVNTIIRRKFAMRSGETDDAVTVGSTDAGYSELMKLGRDFAEGFSPKGLTDVDVIMNEKLKPVIIDINGRFGGGYPFSHAAGADVPRAYVLWLQGRNEEAAECCRAAAGVHGYKDISPRRY